MKKKLKRNGPRVLIFDIETSPLLAYCWGLWDQTVGLNQIKNEWFVLSWSAKWLGDSPDKVMYQDSRNSDNIENDKELLKKIWKLLDQADVVITQNGKKFDQKKLNARFILNGFQPPSSYKHIDTLVIAKKHFGFTSNKLEWMTEKLCTTYKKQKHTKFSGFELWKQCLAGNPEAWSEMEKYNRYDVLSLEELYTKLIPWDTNAVNFNLYTNSEAPELCKCGSSSFIKKGFYYTAVSKYQRYRCVECGSESRDRTNLMKKKVRANTVR